MSAVIQDYPPVRALSLGQNSLETFLGERVDPSEYASFAFAPDFVKIYGEPTLYYSDFYRLMATAVNAQLVPRIRQSFTQIAQNTQFLYFCGLVDRAAERLSLPVLRRREIEAAWTQFLVAKYEKVTDKETLELIQRKNTVDSKYGARNVLKSLLNKAIERVRVSQKLSFMT
jgi:hypothetical protein